MFFWGYHIVTIPRRNDFRGKATSSGRSAGDPGGSYLSVFLCRLLLILPVAAVGLLLAVTPTLAHHSRAMFDVGKNITYRGVVKEYRWQNPHSHIVITVAAGAADPSTVGTWTVEASAISVMTASGWTPRTYKPGDPITMVAHPNRDGSNPVLLFYAIKADGTRLFRATHRYPGEEE